MIGAGFFSFLKAFPWTECRQIFSNPSVNPYLHGPVGVSFDWEHLMSSAFVDAKTIVREWLLYKRVFQSPEEIDFSDLEVSSSDLDLKKLVFARSVLHESNRYFDILAMAYLYFCSVYEEEREFMAVFSSLKYMTELSQSRAAEKEKKLLQGDAASQSDPSDDETMAVMIRFPDWPIFARWLRESVADVEVVPRLVLSSCGHLVSPVVSQLLQNHPSLPVLSNQHESALAHRVLQVAGRGGNNRRSSTLQPASEQLGEHSVIGSKRPWEPSRSSSASTDVGPVAAEAEREWMQAEAAHRNRRNLDSMVVTGAPVFHHAPDGSHSNAGSDNHHSHHSASLYGAATRVHPAVYATTTEAQGHGQGQRRGVVYSSNDSIATSAVGGMYLPYGSAVPTFSSYSAASQYASLQQQQQQQQQYAPKFVGQQPLPLPEHQYQSTSSSHQHAHLQQLIQRQQDQAAATLASYRQNPNHQHMHMRQVVRASALAQTAAAARARATAGNGFGYVDFGSYAAPNGTTYGNPQHIHDHVKVLSADSAGIVGDASAGTNGGSLVIRTSSSYDQQSIDDLSLVRVVPASPPGSKNGATMYQQLHPHTHSHPHESLSASDAGAGPGANHSLPVSSLPAPLQIPAVHTGNVSAMNMNGASSYYTGNIGGVDPVPLPLNASAYGADAGSSSAAYLLQQHQQLAVNRRQKKNRDKFRVTFLFSSAVAVELVKSHNIVLDALPSTSASNGHSNGSSNGRAALQSRLGQGQVHGQPGQQPPPSRDLVPYSVLVPFKGIDVLTNGRYRVQLNTFMNGRKKFSRNSTDLYEALWIFEIALLISDAPPLLSELQRIGNYNCLAPLGHLGFFCNPREYYLELGRHILLFYDTVDFFNEDLITLAIRNYDALKPAVALMPAGMRHLASHSPTPCAQAPLNVGASAGGGGSSISIVAKNYSTLQNLSAEAEATEARDSAAQSDSDGEGEDDAPGPRSRMVDHPVQPRKPPAPVRLTLTSRTEELVQLPWMSGFSAGLSLQEQQLSCLFCSRNLPLPVLVPHISMLKEEKYTGTAHSVATAAHDVASSSLATSASANVSASVSADVLPRNHTTAAASAHVNEQGNGLHKHQSSQRNINGASHTIKTTGPPLVHPAFHSLR